MAMAGQELGGLHWIKLGGETYYTEVSVYMPAHALPIPEDSELVRSLGGEKLVRQSEPIVTVPVVSPGSEPEGGDSFEKLALEASSDAWRYGGHPPLSVLLERVSRGNKILLRELAAGEEALRETSF